MAGGALELPRRLSGLGAREADRTGARLPRGQRICSGFEAGKEQQDSGD
jgi:hypothetical protein